MEGLTQRTTNICPKTRIPEKVCNQVSQTPPVFSRIILLLRNRDVSQEGSITYSRQSTNLYLNLARESIPFAFQ